MKRRAGARVVPEVAQRPADGVARRCAKNDLNATPAEPTVLKDRRLHLRRVVHGGRRAEHELV